MALTGLKVIEFAGLAPGPFAGLVLADNGATVIRIDRPDTPAIDILCRGKRSIVVDSKVPSGREFLRRMVAQADVVIDPFRPGVMERLGLGPEVFLDEGGANVRLIYARIVGFPRTGPHKDMAGHDINYAALSGVLSMLPGEGKPNFPLNILSDFAGGGMMCALGILLALIERGVSGKGQVVNADMVTGTRYISSFPLIHTLLPSSSLIGGPRGTNFLDGGAPFYNVYACKGGGWMAVGCFEQLFFENFVRIFMQSLPEDFPLLKRWEPTPDMHGKREQWPRLKEFLERGFLTGTREYWTQIYHGKDACTVPVLTPEEVAKISGPVPEAHPYVKSHTAPEVVRGKAALPALLQPGQHTLEILEELGIEEESRRRLLEEGALGKNMAKL